jgi:hypothetical protein
MKQKTYIILFVFLILIIIFGCIEANYVAKYKNHIYYTTTNSSDYDFYNKCDKIDLYVLITSIINISLIFALIFGLIELYCKMDRGVAPEIGSLCICIMLAMASTYFSIFAVLAFMLFIIFPKFFCFTFWLNNTPELLIFLLIQFCFNSIIIISTCIFWLYCCICYMCEKKRKRKRNNVENKNNNVIMSV